MENQKKLMLPKIKWDISPLKKDPEKQFFLLTGFWFLFVTFAGFADTFYLKKGEGQTPGYLMVHGIVYSIWVLLYFIQCILASSNNIWWHMLLGSTSLIVLPLVLISGFYTILYSTTIMGDHIRDGGTLTEIALGVLIAFIAVIKRKDPYIHKRLMILAMTILTVAAVQRLFRNFWSFDNYFIFYYIIYLIPLLASALFDNLYFKKFKFFSIGLLLAFLLFKILTPYTYLFNSDLRDPLVEALNSVFLW